ncbi:MAG: hypothetical protein KY469_00160 [Actinobacteria bacterium]|nr:hypothetical protein [Actinomycetota bacterium]
MPQTRRYPNRRAEAPGGGARTEVGASVAREVRGGYDAGRDDDPVRGDDPGRDDDGGRGADAGALPSRGPDLA